jgi:serine/threonine-protein phosphatase 6 regulatory ankyrin repeat subunit B
MTDYIKAGQAIRHLNPNALKELITTLPQGRKETLLSELSHTILDTHYRNHEGLTNDDQTNIILILEELVRNNVNINCTQDTDYPIMHNCTQYPGIVRELIRHGYDIDAIDDLGWTVLATACFNAPPGDVDRITAEILLASGADPNVQEIELFTPLMACADSNPDYDMTQLMQTLIDYGADVNLRDELGYSALDYAIGHGNVRSTEFLTKHNAEFPHPENNNASYHYIITMINSRIAKGINAEYWTAIRSKLTLPEEE